MRTHPWRDCQAWADEGIHVGTVSNEAAKYYDACLTQFIGWYDDHEVGGIVNSMQHMIQADPDFCLGRAFNLGLRIAGTLESIHIDKDLQIQYESLKSLMDKNKDRWSQRENMHTTAVLLWAEGKVASAANVWEDILLDHPTDIHAVKMASLAHFYLGEVQQIRDSVARVLPVWEASRPPLKSFLYGLYSFGLEETGQYQKAEQFARRALQEEKRDGWSTHSLAHVFEMEGRTKEGIQFMTSTAQNWEESNLLACHNYWHVALYHLENEDYENAVKVLDKEILQRALNRRTMLDISDVTSLMYRIEMLNPSMLKSSHWEQVLDLTKPYSKCHISTFNDMHFMMTYAASGRRELANELLETVTSFKSELADHPGVTIPMLQAIADFNDKKYGSVVDGLYPIRYKIRSIGGSYAQTDVLNLMLILACLKSKSKVHRNLARALIREREGSKSTLLGHRLLTSSNNSV